MFDSSEARTFWKHWSRLCVILLENQGDDGSDEDDEDDDEEENRLNWRNSSLVQN